MSIYGRLVAEWWSDYLLWKRAVGHLKTSSLIPWKWKVIYTLRHLWFNLQVPGEISIIEFFYYFKQNFYHKCIMNNFNLSENIDKPDNRGLATPPCMGSRWYGSRWFIFTRNNVADGHSKMEAFCAGALIAGWPRPSGNKERDDWSINWFAMWWLTAVTLMVFINPAERYIEGVVPITYIAKKKWTPPNWQHASEKRQMHVPWEWVHYPEFHRNGPVPNRTVVIFIGCSWPPGILGEMTFSNISSFCWV